jgi:DNA-binding NarL/FixJ family response regulator
MNWDKKSTERLTVEEPRLEPVELGDIFEPLSDREMEVLRLIAAGLSNREIAETLGVALSTAKNHVRSIYGKPSSQPHPSRCASQRARLVIALNRSPFCVIPRRFWHSRYLYHATFRPIRVDNPDSNSYTASV